MDILGKGIYSASEASRLSGVSTRRIHYWFAGSAACQPLGMGDYDSGDQEELLLSFLDLIEAKVIGTIREKGVSLQYLRKVYRMLTMELETPHPFARKDFYTDGRRVWVNETGREGELMREILSGQHAFPPILKPFLECIQYDQDSLLAKSWMIAEGILINPEIRYGKPVVVGTGVPAELLAAAYSVNNGDAETVAEWYDVTTSDVIVAVAFKDRVVGKVA